MTRVTHDPENLNAYYIVLKPSNHVKINQERYHYHRLDADTYLSANMNSKFHMMQNCARSPKNLWHRIDGSCLLSEFPQFHNFLNFTSFLLERRQPNCAE